MIEIIVGQNKLDLPDNFEAVFNFDFLNLEDFSKIGAAYSYTINLPPTPINDFIFEFARKLNSETQKPYQRIVGIVKLYGIEIDNAANIKLAGFDGQFYQINLLLNVSDIASQLGNKTLQNLNLETILYNRNNLNYNDNSQNYMNFVGVRTNKEAFAGSLGIGDRQEVWWRLFYSTKMLFLFKQIFAETTYDLLPTLPPQMEALNDLFLHCINEKTNVEIAHEQVRQSRYVEFTTINDILFNYETPKIFFGFNFTRNGAGVTFTNGNIFGAQYYILDPLLTYTVKFKIILKELISSPKTTFSICYVDDLNNILGTMREHRKIFMNGIGEFEGSFTFSGNVPNGRIFFRAVIEFNAPVIATIAAGSTITIEPTNYIPENVYQWDYAQNQPAITQKEFVKTMLLLSGCTLKINAFDKKVQVIAIEDFINSPAIDITNLIDWGLGGVIDYNPDISQNNVYKFQNTLSGSYNYAIANENLPPSREIGIGYDTYPLEPYYNRFAPIELRKINQKKAMKVPSMATLDFDGNELRTHSQRNMYEVENDYKELKPFFGRGSKTMFHPDLGSVYGIGCNPFHVGVPPVLTTYTGFNVYTTMDTQTIPYSQVRALDCVQNIADVLNLEYADKIYKNHRKVKFKILISILLLKKLTLNTPVFIGGNINRNFIISSIKNWSSPHKLCEIELIRINYQ